MLTEQQRSFLKLNVLMAAKYAGKGMIIGLGNAHRMLANTIISSVSDQDFLKLTKGSPETGREIYSHLTALAQTIVDEDVLQHGCDTVLKENLTKIKIEILTELLDALNDSTINENIEADDINFILDDPNIQVKTAQTPEDKEAIINDIAKQTGADVESVREQIEKCNNGTTALHKIKLETTEEKVLNDINNAFDTKNGKVDLSNVINFMAKKKEREGKLNDISNS